MAEMLVVEIRNERPVDVVDLATSLSALGRSFQEYMSEAVGEPAGNISLGVERIESGSIVATLVPTVEQMTWLWEHRGDVAGFVTHIKDIAEYLLGSAPVAKALIGKKEIERTAQIVEPVAKDNGAQFNISARDNSRVIVNYIINSRDANALQNAARRITGEHVAKAEEFERGVLMVLEQVKNNPNARTGDRGIIEKISPKAVRLRFAGADVKNAILDLAGINPLRCAYLVDVRVHYAGGEPKLYEVLSVEEVLPD